MRLNERGAMLLETVLAMAIMTIAGLALIALVQKVSAVTFKAREQQTCGRMIQTGFSRVKNIDFYNVFAADSNSADYGPGRRLPLPRGPRRAQDHLGVLEVRPLPRQRRLHAARQLGLQRRRSDL